MITIWKDPNADWWHVQMNGITLSIWANAELARLAVQKVANLK